MSENQPVDTEFESTLNNMKALEPPDKAEEWPLDHDTNGDDAFRYRSWPTFGSPVQFRMPVELASGIVAAQRAAAAVEKNATNSFHRYRYASAEAIIAEARQALHAGGLALVELDHDVQDVSRWKSETSPDGRRTVRSADLDVRYALIHENGSCAVLRGRTPCLAEAGRPEDKAVATALTYSLGYMLRSLLLLPRVEEGTDVDQRDDRQFQPAAPKPRAWTPEQKTEMQRLIQACGFMRDTWQAWCKENLATDSVEKLEPTLANFERVTGLLNRLEADRKADKNEREAIEGDKRSAAASRAVDAVMADHAAGGEAPAGNAADGAPAVRRRRAAAPVVAPPAEDRESVLI